MSALSLTLLLAWYTSSFAIALGHYGWTLFVGLPYCLGFFTAGALRLDGVKRFRTCLGAAFCAALFLGLSFLAMGKEGGICLVMVLPIALPLIFLGASTGYLLFHKPVVVSAGPAALLLVLGLGLTLWAEGPLSRVSPTYAVTDSVAIHAPLPVVWSSLLTMGPLGQPADLLFRLGVACPQRVDIYGTGVGAMRVCTLTTGQLAERITVWRPLHELAWVSLSTPPPLQEWNPFQKTDPPHLHGYYRSVSGRFELQSLGPQLTLVTRRSSYQHHLFPAAYWRIWCDYVARRGHLHVLGVLKHAAEERAPEANPPLRPRVALR